MKITETSRQRTARIIWASKSIKGMAAKTCDAQCEAIREGRGYCGV